ncbi:MAG: hypothetical protein JXX29_19325 [Deltaproteobacteria bacterium]|nr:hypothetical protein [Deltaproteobacteria bacterium]MBN2673840.1 hypothetical protein [Deltaproteobacteria bacterium]
MKEERRTKRSHNVHEALELQLEAIATRASFNSVILAEHQGIPVAGAGKVFEDEEIAALAPRLVPGKKLWQGKVSIDNGPEKQVTIAPIKTDVGDLFICGVGGQSSKVLAELLVGSKGVNRILA